MIIYISRVICKLLLWVIEFITLIFFYLSNLYFVIAIRICYLSGCFIVYIIQINYPLKLFKFNY